MRPNLQQRLLRGMLVLVGLLALVSPAASQDRMNVFFIGHSLMSDLPGMTRSLTERHAGVRFSLRHQDIPGAPLRWQWEAKDRNETFDRTYGGRYHIHLPSGEFDTVVLTEGVPRGGEALEAETIEYLGRFVRFIRQSRPDAKIFLYVTWPHLTSGTPNASPYDGNMPTRHLDWRARIEADQPMWQRMVDTVNQANPGAHPVRIIPGGLVLAALRDDIVAGRIPEWQSINQLFSDEIHINHYGKYAMALTISSVLTGKRATGAPSNLRNLWGEPIWNRRHWDGKTYAPMKDETVLKVQEAVDRVVFAPR